MMNFKKPISTKVNDLSERSTPSISSPFGETTISTEIYDEIKSFLLQQKDFKAQRKDVVKYLRSKSKYQNNTIEGTIFIIRQKIKARKITEMTYDTQNHEFCLLVDRIVPSINTSNNSNLILKETSKEEAFYQPFAEYLVKHLKECTGAIPLGGSQFKDKWGTPDVFGIYKFPDYAPLKPFPEIVSAEIKLDETQIITAFGQACAYKLFSHKVYLVLPSSTISQDISRTESLCMKFGIGLITFDKDQPKNPNFTIRTRAIKHEPDYSFVNSYLEKLTPEQKNKLF